MIFPIILLLFGVVSITATKRGQPRTSNLSLTSSAMLKTSEWKQRLRRQTVEQKNLFISLDRYHSLKSMEAYFRRLAKQYPHLVEVSNIGETHENRSIHVVKLGTRNGTKPAIWVGGNLHAREWAASHSALYYIGKLLTDYLSGENTERLTQIDWLIAPMLNPDGYSYTFKNADSYWDRLHRANRSPIRCHTTESGRRKCCRGVDLNRNFDFHWAGDGRTSSDPCSQHYHGPTAFSEPETRAIRDFILNNRRVERIKAAFDLHSFAQLLMYPFSYKEATYPADIDDVKGLAERAAAKIRSVYGAEYKTATPADHFYAAPGTAMDWMKHVGVKYSYTIELRPQFDSYGGFILEVPELQKAARESFSGVTVVADQVIQEFA